MSVTKLEKCLKDGFWQLVRRDSTDCREKKAKGKESKCSRRSFKVLVLGESNWFHFPEANPALIDLLLESEGKQSMWL